MGESFTFVCEKCGYETMSSGKGDAGMLICTEPYVCPRCRIVSDLVVSELKDVTRNGTVEKDFVDVSVLRCERCGSRKVIKWDLIRKPCPKCGGRMRKGGGLAALWD